MTEKKKAACKPRYKREFSIFEDETLEKLKDFRAARSNWITSNANQAISIDNDEGFYKSNEYKGRWAFLRRKWFLTFLHAHHKTLRPPRYYTLKQKLSKPSLTEVEKMKQRIKARGKSVCKTLENVRVRSPENKFETEKFKKKKKTKKRRSSSDDFFLRALYPSKKAIKKLKAAKLENRMIESCRCDDGKELTVVIKGVCLCDKTSLNKFKLDKVCNEYTKLENKNTELTKSILPQAKDSFEVLKKKGLSRYNVAKESDEEEENKWQSELNSTKKIKFVDDQSVEKGNKVKTSTKLERMSSVEVENSADKEIKLNEKTLKEKADQNKTDLTESQSQKNLRLQHKSNTDLDESVEINGRNESTLTLYKNRAQQQSDINLTQEQSEKMKKT